MSKKLSGNGLWESSRMMLPEHKEQLLATRHGAIRHDKPLLDEQVLAYHSSLVMEAMAQGKSVRLTVFDPLDRTQIVEGVVKSVDPAMQRIQIVNGGHTTWVPWDEVVDVV